MVIERKIFVSWAHENRRLKEALIKPLMFHLHGKDIRFSWWQDSHLIPGEEMTEEMVARVGEADYGLHLLSAEFFASSFIRAYEVPPFMAAGSGKGTIPVALGLLSLRDWDSYGFDRRLVFGHDRPWSQLPNRPAKERFVAELAARIRQKALHPDGIGYV